MKNFIFGFIYLSTLIIMYSCTPIIYTQPTVQAPPPQYVAPPPPPPQFGPQPSFQIFYDELGPYGSWVEYPNYGYVWIPRVGMDFEPYSTNGHWVYTDQGWTWASDFSWGWAPFHYGSWFLDNTYGWMWVPGHDWAPAWVTWGTYNNYYCWAPVSPGPVHYGTYRPAQEYWHFVPSNHITDNNVSTYVVENNTTVVNNVTNITIINNTNNYNHVTYNQGPKKEEVERVTKQKIIPVALKEAVKSAPIQKKSTSAPAYNNPQNNTNSVNRPSGGNNNQVKQTQVKPAPAKVEKIENIPHYQKKTGKSQQQKKAPAQKEEPRQKSNEEQPDRH